MKRVSPEVQDLLRSIPGIGDISSAVLIAYVGDINRFSSPGSSLPIVAWHVGSMKAEHRSKERAS
jgi:transposase